MNKILIFFSTVLLIIFILPILFTNKFETKEVISNESFTENIEEISKNKNNDIKIKLLHKQEGNIEEIDLEEYLLGVVSAEMPANYEEEALKAQAIVARTYTIYTIKNSKKHNKAEICDEATCCQAWISKEERLSKWEENYRDENWKNIENAVYETNGKVITYNGDVINAFFHSNSGGKTEVVSSVWGGTDLPYLQSVETSGESEYSQYYSEITFSKEELENKIKDTHPEFVINYNEQDCIKIVEYTSGNRVKTIKIGNLNLSGVEIRSILGLKSANFEVELNETQIKFSVIGYGHGVGMSQTGANTLAKQGYTAEEIIKHFYTDVEINNL